MAEYDIANEENLDRLSHAQRLKAAVYHSTMKICQEQTESKNVRPSRLVIAAISEAAWKKCEQFATDLELFAKHAKRSTVNADDVKMLVRKSPKLLQHLNNLHDEMVSVRGEPKKRAKKGNKSSNKQQSSVSTTVVEEEEEEEEEGS